MKTSTEKYTDQNLLQLLDRDPQRGMAAVVEQYTGLLWRVAGRHLENPEDIKECVNDAFMEFYLHRDRYDPEKGTVTVYLAQIVRNLAISRYRKNAVREAFRLPEDLTDPEDLLGQAEDLSDLNQAMAALKPEDAEIIRMKYYGGMTVQEIADSLGLSYESVKKRHQRSLSKLKLPLLGLAVLALLAALAACTYVVLRYFGIIPGYGIVSDPQAQVYILDEAVQVEDALGRYELDSAMWLERELHIQVQFYPKDPGFMALDRNDPTFTAYMGEDAELLLNGEPFCTAWIDCARMGMHEAENGTHFCFQITAYNLETLPSPEDRLELAFEMNGHQFSFQMNRVKADELSAHSYRMGSRGGLLAIPRMEDGRLLVGIYPLNTGEETILPGILWGDAMRGKVGDITITAADGTELTGEFIPRSSMGSPVYFYDWDFGPAEPGKYTLHVPYVYLSVPMEDPVALALDVEQGRWTEERFPVFGGAISIEDCVPLEPGPDVPSGTDDRVSGEDGVYWSLKLRYHPAEDLVLTDCRIGLSPEMEVQNKVVEEMLVDGEAVPAVWDRGFGPTGIISAEDNLVEIGLKGWEGCFDPSNVLLTVAGPLNLRWDHSFDLPLLVEAETEN